MTSKDTGKVATLPQKIMAFSVSFNGIQKVRENKHLGSKFANFDDIWSEVKGPLQAAGLSAIFDITHKDQATYLSLTISDGSDSLVSVMPIVAEKPTAQALGSMLTYLRRYMLCTVLNITEALGDVDDDGHEASAPKTLTDEQQGELYAHASELFGDDAGKTIRAMALNVFQVKDFKLIPAANYEQAITMLDKKAAKIEKESA